MEFWYCEKSSLFSLTFLDYFLRMKYELLGVFWFCFLMCAMYARALKILMTKNLPSKPNVICANYTKLSYFEGHWIYFFFPLSGYGTIFPRTAGGQMFCVFFAAIGIPLTIICFKCIGKLVSLPFENLGNYLKCKGIKKVSFLSLHTSLQAHTQTHTYLVNFCF